MDVWNRQTVLHKVASIFPGKVTEALAVIDKYNSDIMGDVQICRVHLAILKLCEEGSGWQDLVHYTEAARLDFRDVLAWAEYPSTMCRPANGRPNATDSVTLQKRDKEQYQRWLDKV